MKHTYRPDIDGLRALAVLSVLFFHAGIKRFEGGYVGVDIFFVISGYLITNIIRKEIHQKTFSIFTFYERRIRRIFPALFVVIGFSSIVSLFLLLPNDLINFGQSVVAATLFVSNVLFQHESGYFDAPVVNKPLLHTWSLAVEEQYYILYPLLLIFFNRFTRRQHLFLWLSGLSIISLVLSIYGVANQPTAAFYLVHTRAWELLLGSILAVDVLPRLQNTFFCNMLAAIGMCGIGSSVLLYSATTPFPGMAAMVPTIGTGLLIYSGLEGESFVKRLLSYKPLVFIGLISYSLYLWHWPILVFTKYFTVRDLTSQEMIGVLVLIFGLSAISWRFVEQPFRRKGILENRNQLFVMSAGVMLFAVTFGGWLHLEKGLPERIKVDYVDINEDKAWREWGKCQENDISKGEKLCRFGADAVTPTILLWGDSHARAIASAVDSSASKFQRAGLVITRDSCPPLLITESLEHQRCRAVLEEIIKYITNETEINTVILAARWAFYATGTPYKAEQIPKEIIAPWSIKENANSYLFTVGIKRTIEILLANNIEVVLVEQVPEIGIDVPTASAVAQLTSRDINSIIAPSIQEYAIRNQPVSQAFDELERMYKIQIIHIVPQLCDDKQCLVAYNGQSLYFDDDHLSTYGAQFVSVAFDPLFQKQEDRTVSDANR